MLPFKLGGVLKITLDLKTIPLSCIWQIKLFLANLNDQILFEDYLPLLVSNAPYYPIPTFSAGLWLRGVRGIFPTRIPLLFGWAGEGWEAGGGQGHITCGSREHDYAIVRKPHVVQVQNFNRKQHSKKLKVSAGAPQSAGPVAYATSATLIRHCLPYRLAVCMTFIKY